MDSGIRICLRLVLVAWLASAAACAGTRPPAPSYPRTEAVVAPALEGDADVAEIRKQYERMARAFAAQDVEAIAAIRTADFYAVLPNGDSLNASQMLDVLQHFFVQNKPPIKA